MGLVPETKIAIVNIAPLGDPIELRVRDSKISIRRKEASEIQVRS
jgi:ferrous iron transport protein A